MVSTNTLSPKDVQSIVEFIASDEQPYFVDSSELDVEGSKVEHFNTVLSVFAAIGKKNVLYVGSPGTGKTTLASIVCTAVSGLPFDLFEGLKIQGHPDQTKDTLLMRPDIGRLAEEAVVVQSSLYLPCFILDEINRLTPGKQAIVLEYLRTGVAEHLGTIYSRGKIPVFCTMNHNGAGTYPLTPPNLDRFDLSIEVPKGDSFAREDIRAARRHLESSSICDQAMSLSIRTKLNDKRSSPDDKVKFLTEFAMKNLKSKLPVNPALIHRFSQTDVVIPYSSIATTFQRCIWEELNTTNIYGENRACDPRDNTDHNQTSQSKDTEKNYFGNAYAEGGISQRCDDAIHYFSTMLAWYLGHKEVTVNHIMATAPYCISHRAQFAESYKALYTEQPRLRGERTEQDLARRVLEGVKKNYDNVSHQIGLADAYLANTLESKRFSEVEKFVKGVEPDHPLLRLYWRDACKKHTI